jgi:lysophospholipase
LQLNSTGIDIPSALKDALQSLLQSLGNDENDIASYEPNPFYGWNPTGSSNNANTTSLTLVDGGEDNQNIPFVPLIQPARQVDVIFANDNSADTSTNWPNGSSLVQTYQRSFEPIGNGTAFPDVPDTNTFINLGLNSRPTFFGCNVSNITLSRTAQSSSDNANGIIPPLVVYIPNSPYVTYSNEPTVTLETNTTYRNAMVANGYNVATMANGTIDGYENWPQCVACAILSRSFDRTGTNVPETCQRCFDQYCWNGTVDSRDPGTYEPQPRLQTVDVQSKNAAGHMKVSMGVVSFALAMSVLGLVL